MNTKSQRIAEVAAAFLAAALLSATAGAAEREFTDKKGRKITAELLGVDGKYVRIETGGKEVRVEIGIFSEGDQQYIKKWVEDNPHAIKYAFRFEVDPEITDSKTLKEPYYYYGEKYAIDKGIYNLKVTNAGRTTIKGLTIKYRAYIDNQCYTSSSSIYPAYESSSSFSSNSDSYAGIFFKEGEAKVDELPFNHTREVQTPAFRLERMRTDHYDGKRYKDRLVGAWIRVYNGDLLVGEYKSDARELQEIQWLTKEQEAAKAKLEREEAAATRARTRPKPPGLDSETEFAKEEEKDAGLTRAD